MEFDLSFLHKRRTVEEVYDTVKDLNPDDVAKAWELEKSDGIPFDVAQRDPLGMARVRDVAHDVFNLANDAPVAAEYLEGEEGRRMAVAQDSIREIREMEQAMRYAYPPTWGEAVAGSLAEMGKSIARSYPASAHGYLSGLRGAIRKGLSESYAPDQVEAYLEGRGELPDAPVDGALDLPGMAANAFTHMGLHRALYRAAGDADQYLLKDSYWKKPFFAPDKEFQARLEMAGGAKKFLGDTVGGVAMMGEIMAFSFIGGPPGAALAILSNITGMEYEQYTEAGVEPGRAFNAAFLSAVAQWPLESMSLGRALAVWKPKTILAERFKALLHSVVTEGVTEYSQSYIEELSRLFATQADARTLMEVQDFWTSVFSYEFQAQAGYQGAVGAASAGVTGGTGMIRGLADHVRAAKVAARSPRVLEELFTKWQESGLLPESVFVPAGDVQVLFQGARPGELEAFLEKVDVSPAEFREALEAEGEVALPSRKLGRMLLDERGQALRDKLAVSPEEARMLRGALKGEGGQADAGGEQAEGDQAVALDPEERVRLDELFRQPLEDTSPQREVMKARFMEDGGVGEEEAGQYAALVDAQARIWAEVMGRPVDDYYRRYGWGVRESRAEDFTGGQALFQALEPSVDPDGDIEIINADRETVPVWASVKGNAKKLIAREIAGEIENRFTGLKFDLSIGNATHMVSSAVQRGLGGEAHIAAVRKVRELMRVAVPETAVPDRKNVPGVKNIQRFYAPLGYADSVYTVSLLVKEYGEERIVELEKVRKLYDLKMEKQMPADSRRAAMHHEDARGRGSTGISVLTVRQLVEGVKGSDNEFLLQDKGEIHRGATVFKEDGRAVIHFFEAKDLSTAPHEIHHVFRRILEDMALHPDAPAQVREDWAAACAFVGTEVNGEWTVEQEEKWARAGEAYLMEGRAPSVELTGVFQTFRRWLLNIYRHVSALGVKLTDEMRGVFDRMLATAEQAERAKDAAMIRALFDEGEAGDEYFAQVRKAGAAAEEAVQTRREKEYRRMLSQWRRQAKDAAAAHPVLRRIAALVQGDEDLLGEDGGKGLDRDALLRFRDGEDVKALARRRPGLVRVQGGMDPVAASVMLGYEDVDVMLDEFLHAPTVADFVEAQVAEAEAEWESQWRAEESVLTDSFERMLELEADMLAESASRRVVPTDTLRRYVRERVGGANIRQLLGDHSALRAAYVREARAARRQRKAGTAQARKQTLAHKERQRRAVAELRERYRAKDEVGRILRYLARVQKSKTIDPEYREQIEGILSRFDLRRSVSGKAIQRKNALADWIKAREDAGEMVDIPERLRDEAFRTHYKELSLDELRELRDGVKNIERLGRLKHKLLTNKKYRERKAAVQAIVASIYTNRELRKDAGKLDLNPSVAKRLAGKLERFHAQLTKPEFLFHGLDGWEFGGPVWELLFKPLADAESSELALWEEKGKELQAALERIPAMERALWRLRKHSVPEIGQSLTREQMIAVALNSGNAGNLAALRGGYGWDDAQIKAVTDRLTADEWEVVRDVWRIIDSLWPRIEALHKEMAGFTLGKVEPTSVRTPFGTVEGGYYPLQFDRRLSWSARRIDEEEAGREMFENIYRRPTTRSGFTKERTGGKLPVRLSLDVAAKHLSDVIHHVTHAPAVRDVNLLLQQDEVREAIEATAGREMYAILRPWLQHVARPEREYINAWEGMVGHARQGATVVSLGWKFTVASKQLLSFTQTIDEIGTVDSMAGVARFFANPWAAAAFANERSAGIRNRRKQYDREVRDAMKRFSPSGWTSMMKESFFYLIGIMDAVATYPTWLGAYRRGMRQFQGDEHQAVAYADHVVRTTQPAASPKDLAQVQRGTEFWKIFTSFYTFFSVFYNRASMRTSQARARGVGGLPQAMASLMLLWVVPSALSYVISERRVPDLGDEEDRKELLKAMASYGIATVPVARDVMSAVLTRFDYTMSPTQGAFDSVARLVKTVAKDDVDEWQAFKRATEVAGYWGHLPARQIIITTEGILDLAAGRTDDPSRLFFPERH